MNRPLLWTASLLFGVVAIACAAEPAANNPGQHVFYLGDERVVVLRFEVLIDGQPAQAAWADFVDRRFKQLDANGDGGLSGDEQRSLPTVSLLSQLGMVTGASGGALPLDANPADGQITKSEFAGYLRGAGFEPFRVRIEAGGQANMPGVVRRQQPVDESPRVLFEKLDGDSDGQITADDFLNATQRLRKLDLDRDESISAGELVQTANLYQIRVAAESGNNQPPKPTFLAVQPDQPARQLAQQLLAARDGHRGAAKDNRLSFADLGLSAEKLAPFDADTDGALDFEETQQFLAAPPEDVRLIVRLGNTRAERPIEIVAATGSSGSSEVGSLTFGKVQMELTATRSAGADERSLTQRFTPMDQDNNGYLEAMEAQRFGVNATLFALIDADKDGKVFAKEFTGFYLPLMEMEQARVQLDIVDGGRDLYRILDTNSDGRLGPREFQAAIGRMSNWDANSDGKVAQDELPQQFRMAVGRGTLNTIGRTVITASPAFRSPGVRPQQAAGPTWFARMDRNGDGDVSQREFLGPADVFARLDQDANGLLDTTEATATSEPQSTK